MFDSSHAFVENFPIFNVLFNVFNSSSDEMAVLNQHSEFIHINTSYMNTIGYTKPDKILGLSYEYFKGEACEQADVFKHQDKKVLLTQEPFEFLAYHRYADGNWKLLHGEKTCLYDHNQQPCGIFSKAKDVSNHPLYDISRFLLMETDSKSGKINRQSFVYHIKRAHHSTLLTRKELEVLFYFLRGKTAADIAVILNRSKRTIDMHIESIKTKFNVANKSSLIEKSIIDGYMNILPESIL